MTHDPFRDLTDLYEALIDWPKRLAHEEPFYRRLFESRRVARVVDAACGIGHHAALFAGWGLRVEGADVSPAMIARAKACFGESELLRWTVRSFTDPIPSPPADAVVCVGNSLALAGDEATVAGALAAMLAGLRPGGLLLVHVLNLWHLADGPCLWQKCRQTTFGRQSVLLHKGVHRAGGRGYVDLLVSDPAAGVILRSESVCFSGLEAASLEAVARSAGANQVTFLGGYAGQPYDRSGSVDLIMVAEK